MPHIKTMPLSVIHLLAQDEDVPVEVRGALAEGRLQDAGRLLMERFALSCEEASHLVAARVCDDPCC